MKQWGAALILTVAVVATGADTTIDAGNRHVYGANIGWIDARGDVTNGAVIGQHYCYGAMWSANVGWISLGTGAPANGWSYGNASASDWGVNHDGTGRLTGYAHGANIGWITFEQTYGQPCVDLITGTLSGYVWGANIGWIALSNTFAHAQTGTLDAGPDSDNDGIPDAFEYRRVGNLTTLHGGGHDYDGDGMSDADEYHADTDPSDASDAFVITAIARSGNTNLVIWTVQPTRLYRLSQTDSLTGTPTWVDSGLGVMSPGPGPTRTGAVLGSGATNRFYRPLAIVPLTP